MKRCYGFIERFGLASGSWLLGVGSFIWAIHLDWWQVFVSFVFFLSGSAILISLYIRRGKASKGQRRS